MYCHRLGIILFRRLIVNNYREFYKREPNYFLEIHHYFILNEINFKILKDGIYR